MKKPPPFSPKPLASLSERAPGRGASEAHRFGAAATAPLPPGVVDGEALFRDASRHAAEGRRDAPVACSDRLILLTAEHSEALLNRAHACGGIR